MRIQHNIAAMNAYRNYNTNTSAVNKNLEKLSSGYKINRAGDDAAGLAISEKMRAQISGLNAASKNVKDGISLVKTAEGAMQEVQDMLNRMVTLATQSANGTYDNEVDRLNLQKEVDQLRSEINRIADSSNFNGIKLMDGSQEIKTSYSVASPSDTQKMGMQIIADGQLGVDAQAGVFSYDLSQLVIEVKEPTDGDAGDGQALNGIMPLISSDFTAASSATNTSVTITGFASAADFGSTVATASVTSILTAGGTSVTITMGTGSVAKTITVKIAASTAAAVAAGGTAGGKAIIAKGSTSMTAKALLEKVVEAANKQIAADNTANAAKFDDYVEWAPLSAATLVGSDGKISGNMAAAFTPQTSNVEKGASASAAASVSMSSVGQTVKFGSTAAIGSAATKGFTVEITVDGLDTPIKVYVGTNAALAASDAVFAAVATTTTGTAALDAIQDAVNKKITELNNAIGTSGTYIDSVTLTAGTQAGQLTATAMTSEIKAKEEPTPPEEEGSATVNLELNGIKIGLNLKPGTYSGAHLAQEIANALNKIAAGEDKTPATESQIMTLDGETDTDAETKRTLGGVSFTATATGSTLTITMDEPPKSWNNNYAGTVDDMTLKFSKSDAEGAQYVANGGEQFKPTVDVEPIDSSRSRQYGQATINFNDAEFKNGIKDGLSLQLGKTTYTFAIGANSRFKNSENVVDLTDKTLEEIIQGDESAKNIAVMVNRLSKAAAANSTFYVGSDTLGVLSLTEKEGGVDYSVNNLAGEDGAGTNGTGDAVIDAVGGTVTDDGKAHGADATLNDWKGLVKIGQASVSGNGLTLQIGDTSESYNQLTVSIGDIHTKALGIDNINISTQPGAQKAIDTIKAAINTVSSIRGTLGATQNRLEHTANNLSVMTENIQDAESTIRDTDIAEEMMAYTKNNILVQSAQAMLAQANQIPQGVLQLLG